MTDENDILAAEMALGLLTADELAEHRNLVVGDAEFSARIEWWLMQLAPLAQTAEAVAPEDHWPRIAARLPANDNRRALRRWQGLSAVLGTVAAALLVVLVTRSPVAPPVPTLQGPQLAAALSGEAGEAVAITFDGTNRRMTVAPIKLNAGAGDAELWVIPNGATVPVSLGVIAAGSPQVRQMNAAQAAMLAEGATFAISREPRGGSPTGAPTGPVVASGKIVTT